MDGIFHSEFYEQINENVKIKEDNEKLIEENKSLKEENKNLRSNINSLCDLYKSSQKTFYDSSYYNKIAMVPPITPIERGIRCYTYW